MPIGDVSGENVLVESTPVRCPGALPPAGQSARRTRSPRSALRVQGARGHSPPVAWSDGMDAFVYERTPLTRRPFPIVPSGDSVVPPMPGASEDGQTVDADQLFEVAVETEFYYKPTLIKSEAESVALMRRFEADSQNVAALVAERQQADQLARHIEAMSVATCQGVRAEENQRVLQESSALIQFSQTHEIQMATQRQSAEARHSDIMRRQQEAFREQVRKGRVEVRRLRDETKDVSSTLRSQLAVERKKRTGVGDDDAVLREVPKHGTRL